MARRVWSRYRLGARHYETLSLERLLYRSGRLSAVRLLRLSPGDRVLDVGCGTGLSLPLLRAAVGRSGQVVGVDASEAMLVRAADLIDDAGWGNVEIVQCDAAGLTKDLVDGRQFEAVLFAYSLTVVPDWTAAWRRAIGLLTEGARIAIVDSTLPTGRWRVLAPAVRLEALVGGVDLARRPWERLLTTTVDTTHLVLRSGHVHVAAGTLPPS